MIIYCNLCGQKISNKLYVSNNFTLYRCNKCSFIFVFPAPNKKQLNSFYRSFDYYSPDIAENVIRRDAKRSLSIIYKFRKKGSLLDMGCGRGYLLDEAQKIGWEVQGVDFSKIVVGYSQSKLALNVKKGDISKFRTNKKYDVVVINQVIEHFSDPRPLIVSAKLALKPGGILYVATPNINSFLSRIKKDQFDYIIPPEHLSYFSNKSLEYLLTSLGFKRLYCGSWSYSQDFAGVIKSIIGGVNESTSRKLAYKIPLSRVVNISKFKKFKSFIFDDIFCKLFYRLLNINGGGTNLEAIYVKI